MQNEKYDAAKIRDLLTPKETPAPPEDLLGRIQDEIPEGLELPPKSAPPKAPRRAAWRTLALAASLVVTAGAAFFVYRYHDAVEPGLEPIPETAFVESVDASGESAETRGIDAPGASSLTSEADAADDTADDSGCPAASTPAPIVSPGKPVAPESSDKERLHSSRQEIRKKLESVRQNTAPEPARRDRRAPVSPRAMEEKAEATRVEGELQALGYVADGAVAPAAAGQRLESRVAPRRIPAPTPEPFPPAVPPSTGGTAEPNDAPYGDVFFHDYGTNPFIDTEDDRLSTFGLDVDTGSYTVVRRFLRDGHLPEPAAVRVEEMINYFDYGDAPPAEEDFRIHAQGAPSPFAEGERYHLLRFHLRGRDVLAENRRPADLVFVVDVSGSMARENRLGLVKDALDLLLGELRSDDRVALVVYGSRGQVLQDYTTDRDLLRRAIDRLAPGGSTNAAEGLDLAYEMAAHERRRGAISRVILCSDGVANVGDTSAGSILDRIRRHAEHGVELTTVGFGMGNYNDVLMEQLADTGNGSYAYVDELDEARRIFVENLTGTLQTLAAEARVQVEWNEDLVSRYRLIGYENRDIADERFRDDTVDAGEIGAGHAVTALYEIKLRRELRSRDRVGTLRLRYRSAETGEMVELERRVSGRDFAPRWEEADAAFRLTSLVAEFGEILGHSYWAREGDLDQVFRRAQRISPEFAGDAEVADFVSLAGKAARLARESGGSPR